MIESKIIHCKAIGAYIYIWISKQCQVAYVGQTHAKAGVVTRAAQHVRPNGTFRARLEDIGIDWDTINDWRILTYELPSKQEFLSLESSYRLAVEYLVQIRLYQIQAKINPKLRIVSKVTYTVHAKKQSIINIADEIIVQFIEKYNGLK